MESILETKASTILEFLAGLREALSVTFEEGTWAAGLPRRDWCTHAARARAQLSDYRQRCFPGDDSVESAVSQLGDPLCRPRRLLYQPSQRVAGEKIPEAGSRRRAEQLYQQLDMLQPLRQQARRELLTESRKHTITAKLRQIPSLGPIRCALAVALIQTPHRFRTKRQLWSYSGLGLETRDSGEYHYVQGQVRRRKNRCPFAV
jgi:Transposase IS116/IS110/IS902 family